MARQPHHASKLFGARAIIALTIVTLLMTAGFFVLAGYQPATAAPAALGEPGLSFGYQKTFGETEVAYPESSNHLNWPNGVFTVGNSVWIAELNGERALKFASNGAIEGQVGRAGFRDAIEGEQIEGLCDVAEDASGDIWLADCYISHVVKVDADGNRLLEIGQGWNYGSGNDQFSQPLSIALDSAGNVYVSDNNLWDEYGNHRVQIFDGNGAYLNTIGQTGVPGSDNARFNAPHGLAVYADSLYIADTFNHRVQIFDISNPLAPFYQGTIGVSGVSGSDNAHFNGPWGVGADADYVYVADTWNHRIQIFNRLTLAYVTTVGSYGSGNDQFWGPTDVAADSTGRLYVADRDNYRVQQFDPAWNYVRIYGTTRVSYSTDGYHYNRPSGLAVDDEGNIYLAEQRGNRLVKLDASGDPVWTAGGPPLNPCEQLCGPEDVALDDSGRLFATSWQNDIMIYGTDGNYLDTLGEGFGSGSYQFNYPAGVAVAPNGNIYVADANNHRVQVYDPLLGYLATLGETGVAGSDNGHFNLPNEVHVDSAGKVYVVDHLNHRVQVFGPAHGYLLTVGVSGVAGNDYEHLSNPVAVTADEAGRIYVADNWGSRVLVFDSAGAFLSIIGNSYGPANGQMRDAAALAVQGGQLYIAEIHNHRVQKLSIGVPGWQQVNLNGFGDPSFSQAVALAPYGGKLYAGIRNFSAGGQIWRMSAAGQWTQVASGGFGNDQNYAVGDFQEYEGNLYASTWAVDDNAGGEVWRSTNGTNWDKVVSDGFGDPTNGVMEDMEEFEGKLYVSTGSFTTTHGAEIWRSDSGDEGDWQQVVSNGFGSADNYATVDLHPFGGALYATTIGVGGSQLWFSDNGNAGSWMSAPLAPPVMMLAEHQGYLYGADANYLENRVELYRCTLCDGSDWEEPVPGGFAADPWTVSLGSMLGRLYLAIGGPMGVDIWQSVDGERWQQIASNGIGDTTNYGLNYNNAMTDYNGRAYFATRNFAQGGEVWQMMQLLFLPVQARGGP